MKIRKHIISMAVGALCAGFAPGALAGGFGIGTQSGSGTGNAFAGGAAVTEDASVVWSNPAGMTHLAPGRHVAGALHFIKPSFEFRNEGSTGVFAAPGTGEGGDGGDWAIVPNGFFAMDVTPRLRFGVALNVPFGLKTEYDFGWRGQLLALKSEVKTVNINPSLAWRLSDAVSIGAGVSVQRLEASLTSNAAVFGLGIVNLEADDVAYGYNIGVMAQVTPSTRIGAAYRSSIEFGLEGSVTLSALPAGNGGVRGDLEVPDLLSFSVFHVLNPRWELMADVTRTGWGSVQNLIVTRTTGPAAGAVFTTLPFLWDDTWRYSIGANYRLSDRVKLRFGIALDDSPTSDATRTPRLPDEDRRWIAAGAQYRVSKAGVLEVAYAHEFIDDARIRASAPPLACPANCLSGRFESKADILSVQYSHAF